MKDVDIPPVRGKDDPTSVRNAGHEERIESENGVDQDFDVCEILGESQVVDINLEKEYTIEHPVEAVGEELEREEGSVSFLIIDTGPVRRCTYEEPEGGGKINDLPRQDALRQSDVLGNWSHVLYIEEVESEEVPGKLKLCLECGAQESGEEIEQRRQRGREGVETRRPEQVAEGGRNVWAYICCWGEVRSYLQGVGTQEFKLSVPLQIQKCQTDTLNYSKRKEAPIG